MPTWNIIAGGIAQTTSGTTTYYITPKGYDQVYSAAEAARQVLMRDDYTLSYMRVYITANSATSTSYARCRKNGANGNLVVGIGAGATGLFTDSTHNDVFASGDLCGISIARGGAVGSISHTFFQFKCVATNQVPFFNTTLYSVSMTESFGQTSYIIIEGSFAWTGSETGIGYTFRTASTLSNMRVYVPLNSLNNNAIYRTRKNGGAGNQSVTVGAGATGAFEDAVNTDSIAVGNTANYQIDTTAANNGSISTSNICMKSTCNARHLIAGRDEGGAVYPPSSTRYLALSSVLATSITVEATVQAYIDGAWDLLNFAAYVLASDTTDVSTLAVNKGGVSVITISVGAGATGLFENTTTRLHLAAADLINYMVTTGPATSSGLTLTFMGVEQQDYSSGQQPWSNLPNKLKAAGVL